MADTDTISRTVVLVMPDGGEFFCDVTAAAEERILRTMKAKKYGWERAFIYLLRRSSAPCFAHVRNAVKVRREESEHAQ